MNNKIKSIQDVKQVVKKARKEQRIMLLKDAVDLMVKAQSLDVRDYDTTNIRQFSTNVFWNVCYFLESPSRKNRFINYAYKSLHEIISEVGEMFEKELIDDDDEFVELFEIIDSMLDEINDSLARELTLALDRELCDLFVEEE